MRSDKRIVHNLRDKQMIICEVYYYLHETTTFQLMISLYVKKNYHDHSFIASTLGVDMVL